MPQRVLVTTTSFIDTAGAHRDLLAKSGYEVVTARGPLREQDLIELIKGSDKFDAYLCGEDEFTSSVLHAAAPRVRIISKYGVGLDRIDLETANRLGIKVTNTPGVNHSTVAELTFGLLLSLARKIPEHNTFVQKAEWRRFTGTELAGKTLGIFGLGRVGKEVSKRALGFGMKVLAYNTSWSANHQTFMDDLNRFFGDPLFSEFGPTIAARNTPEEVLSEADFISLHINLTKSNQAFLDRRKIALCKRGVYIVNVSRGALVDQRALADAIANGQVAGYGADVVDPEPIRPDNPLLGLYNVHLTPHVGSRTVDSVIRQGCAAVNNIIEALNHQKGGAF